MFYFFNNVFSQSSDMLECITGGGSDSISYPIQVTFHDSNTKKTFNEEFIYSEDPILKDVYPKNGIVR